jgi:hypothetical protein
MVDDDEWFDLGLIVRGKSVFIMSKINVIFQSLLEKQQEDHFFNNLAELKSTNAETHCLQGFRRIRENV